MNESFTLRLKKWLDTPAAARDLRKGAELLLSLTGNQLVYRSIIRNPKAYAAHLEYQLQRFYNHRVADLTHKQVKSMQASISPRIEKIVKGKPTGRREDHDALPEYVQAAYTENADIRNQMRYMHMKLNDIDSTADVKCPDSEKYNLIIELLELEKKYISNYQIYDAYGQPETPEQRDARLRSESTKALRFVNLNKGRYAKAPTPELKARLVENFSKIINPADSLREQLVAIGVL